MKYLTRIMNDSKVRYKLMLIYICTSFLPMFILAVFCYYQMKKIIIEEEKRNVEDYLYQTVASMDNQIQIYNNLSDYISFNQSISQVVSYDYKTPYEMYSQITMILDPMLSSLLYFHNDVNRATIYTDKDITKHDTTLAPIKEIEEQPWYNAVKENINIQWYINKEEQTAFSARRMPMLEKSESFGVLYIDVDYSNLFFGFEQMTGSDYGIFITDKQENVIYSHDCFSEKNAFYALSFEEFMEILNSSKMQDIAYSIVHEDARTTGWRIYLYKPEKLIINYIQPMAYLILLTFVLCILASCIGTLMTSKFLTRRIEKLTFNMAKVENGDMQITVTSDAKDEIGDLIRGFGTMLSQIKLLISEVYEGKIKQKEYEMKALQAQINPHFLYNTLSLINWKALEAGQKDISKITLSLATFYRTALNKGKNILTVEDELNNMRSYLAIQLFMHDDEFDVVEEIDDRILKFETLNLILQPLLENAIEHGLDLKEDGKGVLTIRGRYEEEDEGMIWFEVEDNGVGMEKERAQQILSSQSKGYGVRNVNERIRLYYGEEYSMKIESFLGKGTKIFIHIPARLPK